MEGANFLSLTAPVESLRQLEAERNLENEILALTGGFSRFSGQGYWRADEGAKLYVEQIVRLDVALLNPAVPVTDVLDAFVRYGESAGEKALFYVINGEARMLDLEAERKAGVA